MKGSNTLRPKKLKLEFSLPGGFSSANFKETILGVLKKFFQEGNFKIEIAWFKPKKMRQLNQKYRSKSKAADVLSFPLFENRQEIKNHLRLNKPVVPLLLGSICLSTKLEENSREKILGLVRHSTYHLIGTHHQE